MEASQYKQKKKRAVDPNAPPRPNLLSHEKRMKASDAALATSISTIHCLKKDLVRAMQRITDVETRINLLVDALNRRSQ